MKTENVYPGFNRSLYVLRLARTSQRAQQYSARRWPSERRLERVSCLDGRRYQTAIPVTERAKILAGGGRTPTLRYVLVRAL